MIKSPSTRSRVPRDLNKHGHEFEGLCNDAFNPLEKKYPIKWERIIDSRAAGNIIRDAEGDYRLKISAKQIAGAGLSYDFVIECKASVVENSFNRCFRSLIGSNQLALMRKEARAGAVCIYLFHSVNNREIEVWSMKQLRESYYEKRTEFTGEPRYIVEQSNLKKFAERWVSNPQGFISILGEYV